MNKYYSQYGGNPDWYFDFETNLRGIYNNLKQSTGNLTLTGSGAIAVILKKLNMIDDLNNLAKPNDLDFIYIDKNIYHPNVDNFTKSTDLLVKSITYTRNDKETHLIKSFDLIFNDSKTKICNINIDGIDVLHPKSLLLEYKGNEFDTTRNDNPKIIILKKILEFITKENIKDFECKQFKLDNSKVLSDRTNLPSILFALDDESDVESENNSDKPKNLISNLFGSDDEPDPQSPSKKFKIGGSINELYKQKYLKYKLKYFNLKKNI
jgi:hypothetical protein